MTTTAAHPYLVHLLDTKGAATYAADPVKSLRARAFERASALQLPTTRDEDWRFTDLAPLLQRRFQPAVAAAVSDVALGELLLDGVPERLVFVDGVFQPQLSLVQAGGDGVATALSQAGDEVKATALAQLGTLADIDGNVFTALNTSLLQEAALILVSRNRSVPAPVHVLFVSTQAGVAVYPRVLVAAEAGSDVTLIEEHVAAGGSAYFTNAVAEIVVGAGARVRHIRVQRDAADAFHFGATSVQIARDAHYESTALSFGARLSRHEPVLTLAGEGAACDVAGLALIGARQLADTHSTLDHAVPHGTSRQLHKTIVGGGAHAVFNGRIVVRRDAQRTDSSQQSRNLLLSGKALIDAKPQLEIFADDVKCAHGATVGQLDAEEIFYLRSRGLDEVAARNLLTYAFGAEVVNRVPVPALRTQLERLLLQRTAEKTR